MAVRLPDGIDAARFLDAYWQKRPLLIRGGLAPGAFALTADELAGLACEPDLESRLIVSNAGHQWRVRHGPFSAQDFAHLPERNWTLLVQDVDKFIPGVADLIGEFAFVPTWRIDDVMISYAADGGGVGPHTDAYDVFLMQAQGRRRWRLSHASYCDDDLIDGIEQRILSNFTTDEEWLLEPGDILYLPPNIAHWGIAEGECMTYSLGFRAPDQAEIAADWFQHLVSLTGTRQLMDPDDICHTSPAELTPGLVQQATALIECLPDTKSPEFARWLGCHLTDPKPQFLIEPPEQPWREQDLQDWLATGRGLSRHPFARINWACIDGQPVMFFQGRHRAQSSACTSAVQMICEQRRLDGRVLHALTANSAEAGALLLDLLNAGVLEPHENDT